MAKKRKKTDKVKKVMHEYKEGTLHSGSKKGPKVKDRKQAIAIALSEQRRKDVGHAAEGGAITPRLDRGTRKMKGGAIKPSVAAEEGVEPGTDKKKDKTKWAEEGYIED
jgi:hypothetical protein